MEIGFIVRSLRRRWWLVAIALVAGVLVAASIDEEQTDYRAEALVMVLPDPNTGNLYAGQPDRFVASELSLMRSNGLAILAAEAVEDPSVTPNRMQAATDFSQLPESDIVSIETETADPDLAVDIANAYLDTYLEQYQGRNGPTSQQLLADLDDEISFLRDSIAEIDEQLNEIAAPYVASLGTDDPLPPPNLSILAPELSTERELLLTQLNRTRDYRLAVQRAVQESATSSIVQRATEAQALAGDSSALQWAAVLMGALLLGLIAAPLSFQISDRVAEPGMVGEILGRRPVGHLPWDRRLRLSPLAALTAPTPAHEETERRLWARIEREVSSNRGPTVVSVVSPVERAGATTLCMALARRAMDSGMRTVLVDADTSQPWIAPSFVGGNRAEPRDRSGLPTASMPFGDLSVLDASSAVGQGRSIAASLFPMHEDVDLLIVDAGMLLASAGALEASEIADLVVLTVPLGRVPEDDLRETAALLSATTDSTSIGQVLSVTTRPSRRLAVPTGDDEMADASPPAQQPPSRVPEGASSSGGSRPVPR